MLICVKIHYKKFFKEWFRAVECVALTPFLRFCLLILIHNFGRACGSKIPHFIKIFNNKLRLHLTSGAIKTPQTNCHKPQASSGLLLTSTTWLTYKINLNLEVHHIIAHHVGTGPKPLILEPQCSSILPNNSRLHNKNKKPACKYFTTLI